MTIERFRERIWRWYRRHGRHDLPWRKTHDPYRILVSEVMLQQTQVWRVIPKYRAFIQRFPTIRALHRAPLGAVLRAWQGLGYNRRAKHLKELTRIVNEKFDGAVPRDPNTLRTLPGIGPGTAGAIAAFAFGRRVAFLETNVRRVYLHYFFRRRPNVRDREILPIVERTLPHRNVRDWYYALMDYGAAALRKTPNPNRRSAHYARQPRFAGSVRQLRGRILREVIAGKAVTFGVLGRRLGRARPRSLVRRTSRELAREGLIRIQQNTLTPP